MKVRICKSGEIFAMGRRVQSVRGLFLSIYGSLGIFLGTLWKIQYRIQQKIISREYLRQNVPDIFAWDIGMSPGSALVWSAILSICAFVCLYVFYQNKRVSKSYSFLVLLAFVLILVSIVPGLRNFADILFFLILACVVGMASWLRFDRCQESKRNNASLEALELMHKEYLEFLRLSIWSSIVMTSGIVLRSIILERENLIAVVKQPISTVAPYYKMMEVNGWITLYIVIGIVWGIILQIYHQMVEIRRKVGEK